MARRFVKPVRRKAGLFLSLFFFLSVFICVHPWIPPILRAASRGAPVLTGIDVLEVEKFAPLAGKRVGLITNQTGIDRQRRSTIDLLAHAPGVKLVALFSPEHGIRGALDEHVASTTDAATGLPIYSLYGKDVRPTDAMLEGLDALVFDMQDAGVRFYTYITTMAYTMEAAGQHHLAYYLLDRPNPLGGERMEGPMLDRERTDFVAYFPMPVRMAMTLGEMAQMFNAENKLGVDLHVITMRNWRRHDYFDDTRLPWVNPSPNLRSFRAEILYPGLEILQAGGMSVGRGTDMPFERIGAPWIRSGVFLEEMNRRALPGIRFIAERFTPDSGPYAGQECNGARVVVSDRATFEPMRAGLEIAAVLAKLYPGNFEVSKMMALVGNAETIAKLKAGDAPATIVASWSTDLEAFRKMRAKYLLYQ